MIQWVSVKSKCKPIRDQPSPGRAKTFERLAIFFSRLVPSLRCAVIRVIRWSSVAQSIVQFSVLLRRREDTIRASYYHYYTGLPIRPNDQPRVLAELYPHRFIPYVCMHIYDFFRRNKPPELCRWRSRNRNTEGTRWAGDSWVSLVR